MRATVMHGAGDVRIEAVPDARLVEPTDALVTVIRAAICGSDLWPYKSMEPSETGRRMGHEFIGVVEDVGADVHTMKVGDLVVSPVVWSDGTCVFCQEGLKRSPLRSCHGGGIGSRPRRSAAGRRAGTTPRRASGSCPGPLMPPRSRAAGAT